MAAAHRGLDICADYREVNRLGFTGRSIPQIRLSLRFASFKLRDRGGNGRVPALLGPSYSPGSTRWQISFLQRVIILCSVFGFAFSAL